MYFGLSLSLDCSRKHPLIITHILSSEQFLLFFLSLVGFFVDIDLFKVQKDRASELAKESSDLLKNLNISRASKTETDGLADDDANLMIKLKFLTYKVLAN